MTVSDLFGTVFWWAVTLAVLAVLDDLTFGPAFWVIARIAGPLWGFTAVVGLYVPVQLWLVSRGTSDDPGPVARWFLDRLYLSRRIEAVARNEQQIHSRVVGAVSSIVVSPVIGGVLPPLILSARGFSHGFVRRTAWATSILYAFTFGMIHGIVPALV